MLLPGWRWEAFEKVEDGLYYGQVKSSNTYDNWEWGYFSREQLREAGAYRVDVDPDEDAPLFPDGGYRDVAEVYETELDALFEDEEEDDEA